jgi:hypothetical protein
MSTADAGAHKSQEFYDYITNPQVDMMRIELEILGDPAYISQDMYTTIPVTSGGTPKPNPHSEEVYDGKNGSFNAEQYQPLIKVNYRLPDEINLKEGVMFEKQLSVGENLFFNGIYQVTRVDSRFQNGEFTQVLTCVRLNNQRGEGRKALITPGDVEKLGIGKEKEKVEENLKSKVAYSAAELNAVSFDVKAFNKTWAAKEKARKLKDSLIK